MSMRMAAALTSLVLLSGCYTTRITTSATPRGGTMPTERTNWHFINGLTSADVVAIDCPNGIAQIEQQIPVWSMILLGFTGSIVGATTTKYSCVAGPAQAAPAVP